MTSHSLPLCPFFPRGPGGPFRPGSPLAPACPGKPLSPGVPGGPGGPGFPGKPATPVSGLRKLAASWASCSVGESCHEQQPSKLLQQSTQAQAETFQRRGENLVTSPRESPPPHLKLCTFARRKIILFISSNQQQKNLCSRCKGFNTILPRRLVARCFAFKVPFFFLSPDENSCRHCTTALFVRFPCQADSLLRAEACRSAGGEINFSAHRV